MKVLLSWLSEYAPFGDDAEGLADHLSALGLAVDELERVGTPVPGVITARVLDLRPHPQADRIQLVDVDTGDGEALQICCGAFNMSVGDVVPLASLGTVMPDGRPIERRKLRGEWSNGMLCSPTELGLGGDAGGILLLPRDLPLGVDAFDALQVTPDVVFDLDLTRNRPDAWSHLGVARDLAARLGVELVDRFPLSPLAGPALPVTVEVVDHHGCGRFTATTITGVRVGPSPAWMQERLARAGMRPINNVVDASNYVMLDLGQPNHAYDRAKLAGPGFRVRRATPGETIVTLDGVERSLDPADLLICDAADRPVGLAGVMGSADSEIDDTTTEVVVEAAWFEPLGIAATAARHGLRSEASARFERGVDPELPLRAVARLAELLALSCPDLSVAGGAVDATTLDPRRAPVAVRPSRVNALLATDLTPEAMAALLTPIGFTVEAAGPDRLEVGIPGWRPDCTSEIDLVEEVARHHGYERLGRAVPPSAHPGALSGHQRDRRLLRQVMVGLGASEAMPSPLLGPEDLERAGLDPEVAIALANPMVREESLLRPTLLAGLVRAVADNEARQVPRVSLFEIGHVYLRGPGRLPDERERIGAVLAGREAPSAVAVWVEVAAALDVSGWSLEPISEAGLHPTRTARIVGAAGEELGVVGEVDRRVLDRFGVTQRVAYLEVELDPIYARARADRRYRPVSRFPASDVDLAFVLPDAVPAAALEAAIRDAAGALLVDLTHFDTYRGPGVPEGSRSLAYRLRLQARDRTLTDADVASARSAAVAGAGATGGVLRG